MNGGREDEASDAGYGGYDHEFVDKVPAKYICSICTKVLREARLAECCGQHFCDSCLATWLYQNEERAMERVTCPHCYAKGVQSVLNEEKIREIKELHIYCIHRSEGCDWVGQLGSLEDHLQSDRGCGYVTVTCSLRAYKRPSGCMEKVLFLVCRYSTKCGEKVERRHLAAHEEECRYREYTCEYCGHADTYDAIAGSGQFSVYSRVGISETNHYQECDRFPLECVNECGEMDIRRGNMTRHQETCPLEPLDCPFEYAGCDDPIPRKDMDNHCLESVQDHLLLVAESQQELLRMNEELVRKNEELVRKNEKLVRKYDELTQQFQELSYTLT